MANVLGTLFGDIAAAIRSKTGDTATMKPAEFPDKISAIEVGGSGGGTLVAAKGTFTGTGAQITVTHNLGTVPLVFYTFPTTGIGANVANAMYCAVGFSAEAADVLGISNDYGYTLSWNASAGAQAQGTQDGPIETTTNYPICNATATTICVGGATSFPKNSSNYTWYALGYKKDE